MCKKFGEGLFRTVLGRGTMLVDLGINEYRYRARYLPWAPGIVLKLLKTSRGEIFFGFKSEFYKRAATSRWSGGVSSIGNWPSHQY